MTNLFAYILGTAFPLLLVVTFLIGIRQSNLKESDKKKYSIGLVSITTFWTILVWLMSYLGVFEYQSGDLAPRFLTGLMLPVLVALFFFKSSNFIEVLNKTPQYLVVGIQTLRVLGISFLFVAQSGAGPAAFAGAGYGDLITGVLALIAGLFLLTGNVYSKWAVVAFNAAGMFDLLNVSRILLTYYPSWYAMEPSTGMAGEFPTVLILCIAAPIALVLHIYSLRAVIVKSSSKPQYNVQ